MEQLTQKAMFLQPIKLVLGIYKIQLLFTKDQVYTLWPKLYL